ncbi:MAG: DNA cytosine methyltransferase, partial [Candidatus Paceibacterota bacterium]
MSGGIPCQPHSVAGKRQASADERDLWPEYRRVISELRPKWILVENVPGLFSSENGRFFGNILRDLAALGYSVGWCVYGANDVGAPHKRDRVFIMGHATSQRLQNGGRAQVADAGETESELERCGSLSRGIQALGYASGSGLSGKQWRRTGKEPENGHIESEKKDMADSESYNEGRMCGGDAEAFAGPSCGSKDVADSDNEPGLQTNKAIGTIGSKQNTRDNVSRGGGGYKPGSDWWELESGLGRGLDGISPGLHEH